MRAGQFFAVSQPKVHTAEKMFGVLVGAMIAAVAQAGITEPGENHYKRLLEPYYHPDGYWFNSYNDYLHSVIWLHLHTFYESSR